MSNRTNGGMMAVVGSHKSLQELEQSLMIQNDPAAPNAAAAIAPTPPVVEETEETTVVPIAPEKGREAVRRKKAEATAMVTSAPIDDIIAEFVPETQLRVLHTRIPDWLEEALKDKLGPLERANPRVTKQALVTYCLIKALGVTPPPDFRLW
jgi:hypothetical protein